MKRKSRKSTERKNRNSLSEEDIYISEELHVDREEEFDEDDGILSKSGNCNVLLNNVHLEF
jgi:hypothetical protein